MPGETKTQRELSNALYTTWPALKDQGVTPDEFYQNLCAAVEAGQLSTRRVDDSVAAKIIREYILRRGAAGKTAVGPLELCIDLHLPPEQVNRVAISLLGKPTE